MTRETLERSTIDSLATSADGILSTLNQVFSKKKNLAGIDAIGDGELNPDDLPTIAEADESREEVEAGKQHDVQERCNNEEKAARQFF